MGSLSIQEDEKKEDKAEADIEENMPPIKLGASDNAHYLNGQM